MPNAGHQARRAARVQRTLFAVACRQLILIEAPSSAVPPWDCWRWAHNLKERRRPQAILYPAAPGLLWHRPARPDDVPRHLEAGWGDRAAPAYEGGARPIS